MVRIIHVVGGMNRGGAETLIMSIFRNIDRDHFQFDFAVETNQPCHYDDEIICMDGQIIPHPHPKKGLRDYGKALKKTLQNYGPYDVIHSHVYQLSGYVLSIANKSSVPIRIAHSHNTQDSRPNSLPRNIYRAYMRWMIRHYATHLLGCSRDACESLFGQNCWQDQRVEIFPNAIDLSPYEALPKNRHILRENLKLPVDVPLIGHVGRFTRQKNHQFLIEVFASLLQKIPTAHLVLVGDGLLRPEIEALIKAKGIHSNVHLLGVREDVPEIMGALDLFLFPSFYEGLGIVLVEAQAAGVPCLVANTVPEDVQIVPELLKFEPLDAGADYWAFAISNLLFKSKESGVALSLRYMENIKKAGYDIRVATNKLQDRIYRGGEAS